MFDYVAIRVSERLASRAFYETVLAPLELAPGELPKYGMYDHWYGFALAQASDDYPPTRGLHIAFAAHAPEDVDAFWQAGVAAGYRSGGEPGPRTQYRPDYYGGFLLDPDGNSVEAVHRPVRTESGPQIDHLWLGVANLDASRRFWVTVAPVLGLRVEDARWPGHVVVAGHERHLMLVADGRPPTENLELAFPVADDAAVAEFERRATSAGYVGGVDAGPREPPWRPPHHVRAFVRESNGWNIEAVYVPW
jgi:catechol 2,3-dioxygenase-like lactoylglutathione lyase family enzyme